MSENPNQNQTKDPGVRILVDVSSAPDYNNNVHIEGNQAVVADVLLQLFELPHLDGIVDLFYLACEEYYRLHPDKRVII